MIDNEICLGIRDDGSGPSLYEYTTEAMSTPLLHVLNESVEDIQKTPPSQNINITKSNEVRKGTTQNVITNAADVRRNLFMNKSDQLLKRKNLKIEFTTEIPAQKYSFKNGVLSLASPENQLSDPVDNEVVATETTNELKFVNVSAHQQQNFIDVDEYTL